MQDIHNTGWLTMYELNQEKKRGGGGMKAREGSGKKTRRKKSKRTWLGLNQQPFG